MAYSPTLLADPLRDGLRRPPLPDGLYDLGDGKVIEHPVTGGQHHIPGCEADCQSCAIFGGVGAAVTELEGAIKVMQDVLGSSKSTRSEATS